MGILWAHTGAIGCIVLIIVNNCYTHLSAILCPKGTSIKPLVKRIKVRTADEHKPTMNEAIHGTVSWQCTYRGFGLKSWWVRWY